MCKCTPLPIILGHHPPLPIILKSKEVNFNALTWRICYNYVHSRIYLYLSCIFCINFHFVPWEWSQCYTCVEESEATSYMTTQFQATDITYSVRY